MPPVQGVEFHINLEALSLPSRRLASPRDCIYSARSVRNLITAPRTFSYYHPTEFRVIPFRLCPGISADDLRARLRYEISNERLIVHVRYSTPLMYQSNVT